MKFEGGKSRVTSQVFRYLMQTRWSFSLAEMAAHIMSSRARMVRFALGAQASGKLGNCMTYLHVSHTPRHPPRPPVDPCLRSGQLDCWRHGGGVAELLAKSIIPRFVC
jgi:hypothetical protein